MSAKLATMTVALMLVAAPMAAFAVASTQRQTPLPVTAALHHHYFEVGEHQCEAAIKKAKAQASGGEAVSYAVAITTGEYPEEFRQDVSAGCQAAPQ